MRKFFMPTFCCSLLFLIYIWSWLSWYTYSTVTRGKESPTYVDKDRKTSCIGCILRKEDDKIPRHHSPGVPPGKACLSSARVYGVVPEDSRFLTIGIPSVDRRRGNYLPKTLRSLVDNLDDDLRSNVTIVVLVGDADEPLRSRRANETRSLFRNEVDSGLVLIIQPVQRFYPQESKITRRTFNDSMERVRWRSRQVLDFAFLLGCARDVAEYFLILEDDVEASPRYARAIRDFVSARRGQDWVSLTFSGFFIIGRLLRNSDLQRLGEFLVMFHLEKPVDLLIVQFLDLLVQDRYTVTRRIPGLFQHVGLFSSLGGKIQKARDRSFGSGGNNLGNPPADIVTTLGVYKKHFPEYCYVSPDKFFWGSAPKANDTLDVVLHTPLRLKRLTVVSGHPSHRNDFVRHAEVKLSPAFRKMSTNRRAECEDFRTADLFREGTVDIQFRGNGTSSPVVQCIRIEFVRKQSNWVLIREITVRGESV